MEVFMATMQNQYSPMPTASGAGVRRADGMDWTQEISVPRPGSSQTPGGEQRFEGGMTPTVSGAQLDMKNDLPTEVIDAPTTVGEAQAGSWKALLSRNLGNFVVATFLIGTQGTVAWEGILYDVGNNYLTIYQAGRDRYIVCDIYSLKYIEFYDTNRRQMCDELLRQRGWQPNG